MKMFVIRQMFLDASGKLAVDFPNVKLNNSPAGLSCNEKFDTRFSGKFASIRILVSSVRLCCGLGDPQKKKCLQHNVDK